MPFLAAPGQARLLGHQCPLETVSVGSEGAVRRLWGEESLKCGSTRAARGGAALRISKHLFGAAQEGWWDQEERGAPGRSTVSTFPGAQGTATLWNLRSPGGRGDAD